MVSEMRIAAMAASAVVAIGFPVALLVIWHRCTKARLSAAWVGAGIFFVFVFALEQISHMIFLRPGGYVAQHTWAYALYGALAAGIFEETGRYIGFRFLLKKQTGRETSVMYGIGHGGLEAILLGGGAALAQIVLSVEYNAGGFAGNEALLAQGKSLAAASVGSFLVVGVERIIAVCFHIALSVLVFQAAKRPGKFWLYPAAVLLHAGLDMFAMLYQCGIISGIWVMEVIIAFLTVIVCRFAYKLYRRDVPAADSMS